ESGELVARALDYVLHPELRHPPVHGAGTSAAYHRDLDARSQQFLDTETVLGRERLRLDAVIGKVEPPVREYAVDVESREPDVARYLLRVATHMMPALKRSWMFRAPTSLPFSSATSSPV